MVKTNRKHRKIYILKDLIVAIITVIDAGVWRKSSNGMETG